MARSASALVLATSAAFLLAASLEGQEKEGAARTGRVERHVDIEKEVVVVVNEAIPESVALGEHYAKRRGIPTSQILKVRCGTAEVVPWPELDEKLLEPLKKFLESRKDVLYVVPVYGVPVKPQGDGKDYRSFGDPARGTADCCIDREIELLRVEHPRGGAVPSRVYHEDRRVTKADAVYIVCRLDGPSPEAVRAAIDNAIYGELYGVEGKVFIDTRGLKTPGDGYYEVDMQMKGLVDVCKEHGLEHVHDDKPEVVDLATLEKQGHYWGWYTGDVVCSHDDWRFVRGAVGAHLHSFSAGALRSKNKTWTGPLVHHGITCTWGTVYEPFTVGFPEGTVVLDRLFEGYGFGEAVEMSNRLSSWMAVFVGDPLYAPYAKGVREKQEENRAIFRDAARSIAQALDAGDPAKAEEVVKKVASFPVAYEGAEDTSFLVRETRSRLASPAAKTKGTVAELKKAVEAARSAIRAGDAKTAVASARKALELSPASFDANLASGMASVAVGSGAAAVAPLEAAARIEAGFDVLFWLGRALRSSGKSKEAIARLEAALALRSDLECLRELAEALLSEKRVADAIARLEAAARSHPGDREVTGELGKAYVATRDWKKAVAVLDAAVKDLPTRWPDLRDWIACEELLFIALREDGSDKARLPALEAQLRELKSGRVKPTPAAQASKIAEAIDEAQEKAEKLAEPTAAEEKAAGLPRLRLTSRFGAEVVVQLAGPVALRVALKPHSGRGREKPVDVELVPGVYRMLVATTEAGKPRTLAREQKLEPGKSYALGLDEKLKVVKP